MLCLKLIFSLLNQAQNISKCMELEFPRFWEFAHIFSPVCSMPLAAIQNLMIITRMVKGLFQSSAST